MSDRYLATALKIGAVVGCLMVIGVRGVAAQSDYRIRTQDALTITVVNRPDLSKEYVVGPDGNLAFPLIGRIQAAGLSGEQVGAELQRRLTEYFKNPRVTVKVERPKRVFVLGAVTSPGMYELTENMTLIELLARAGYTEGSELTIVRTKGATGPVMPDEDASSEVIKINLREFEKDLENGKLSRNVVLAGWDTVFVPRYDPNRIHVSGQVRNPGAYSVPDGTTVLQALTLAGGATEHAALGRIRIVRLVDGKQKSIKVKLEDSLQPGDTLLVPEGLPFPSVDFGTADAANRRLRQIRFGSALSLTPAVAITRVGIDTNVFNTKGEIASDFTVAAGPRLEALLDLRRARVRATGAADFVYFHRFDTQRSINRSLAATAELLPSRRITFTLGGGLLSTRDRLNTEVDARARRFERSVDAGVTVRPWRRLDFELSGRDWDIRYDPGQTLLGVDLRETLTERIRSATATAYLALTPLSALLVGATAATHRFALLSLKNADATEFFIGSLFKPRALVSGQVRVGYLRYLALDPAAPDFRGVTGNADLVYEPGEKTRLRLVVERTTGTSFQPRFPYAVIDRYGGSIRQGLFRRLDVLFETYREKFDYRAFAFVDVVARQQAHSETTQRYTSELGFRVVGATRVVFNVSYVQRLAPAFPVRQYNALRMWASMTYGVWQVRGQ